MKTRIRHERGRISLIEIDPTKKKGEENVLAAMTLYEGTGCWQLVDVRLARFKAPSQYSGGLDGQDFCARFKPESPDESAFIRSKLTRYREAEDGTIEWCTFEGIVKGSPTVSGYAPVSYFDDAGYFNKADGLAYLTITKRFWDDYAGGDFRRENPHRQTSETEIYFAASDYRRARKAGETSLIKPSVTQNGEGESAEQGKSLMGRRMAP